MAISFLNEVWAARLLMDLEDESVYKARGNGNYQQDAVNAKQVHIGKLETDITVSNYTINTDISDPQLLTDSDLTLTLDQQKYFNFYVDDVIKAQTTPNFMSEAMRKSAVAISQTIDSYVSGTIEDAMSTENKLTATVNNNYTIEEKGVEMLSTFSDLKTQMRKQNISKTITPWAVLSPAWLDILEKYFLVAGKSGVFLPATSEQVLTQGFMGNLLGINLYWSNRAPQSTNQGDLKDIITAGTNDAFTYADNVTEVVAYRPEKRFGDAVKGLYVYGAKVTLPKQLFKITNIGT